MNILTIFGPLLIMLIITLFIVFIRTNFHKMNLVKVKWIFSGYFFVLLSSVVLFYTLPLERAAYNRSATEEEVQESANDEEFYQAAMQGTIDQVKGVVMKENWGFSADISQLHVPDSNDYILIAKRNNSLNEKIDVKLYTNKITDVINDVVIYTNEFPSPKVELEGSTLKISRPRQVEMKLAKFSNELTIRQFTGEKMFDDDRDRHFYMGAEVLFIQVPKDVKITGDVTIIGE